MRQYIFVGNHEQFLDDYTKLSSLLSDALSAGDDGSSSKEFDSEQIRKILENLKGAMEDFDVDSADSCMTDLEEYDFPGEMQEMYRELAAAVTNLDTDEAADIADSLIELL